MTYNAWPLGEIPNDLQRPELKQLKNKGYKFDDAREVVAMFEEKVAKLAGSKYAVAVDCCSHGIFLSLKYLQSIGEISMKKEVTIPKHTYISVPMQILHAGMSLRFIDKVWTGVYQLEGTRVWDGAVRWEEGMYVGSRALQCVSFQLKKTIPIGRGGMVLMDDKDAYDTIKLLSYDGRDLNTTYDSDRHVKAFGYHMYMTPEDAARGLVLMEKITRTGDSGNWESYPDVEQMIEQI